MPVCITSLNLRKFGAILAGKLREKSYVPNVMRLQTYPNKSRRVPEIIVVVGGDFCLNLAKYGNQPGVKNLERTELMKLFQD